MQGEIWENLPRTTAESVYSKRRSNQQSKHYKKDFRSLSNNSKCNCPLDNVFYAVYPASETQKRQTKEKLEVGNSYNSSEMSGGAHVPHKWDIEQVK